MAKSFLTDPETIKVQFDRVVSGDFFYCNAESYFRGKHIRTTEGFIYNNDKSQIIKKIFGKEKPEQIDLVKITIRIEYFIKKSPIEYEINKKK